MTLAAAINATLGADAWQGRDLPELSDLTEHSAEITKGCAFLALATDTELVRQHAEQARQQGAALVLVDADTTLAGEDVVAIAGLREQRGALAAAYYEQPSQDLRTVAVTGTNGKTSVAFHIADFCEQANLATGYFGTLGWGRLGDLRDVGLTTANAVALQRRLAQMRDTACQHVAMEVSSHALDQHRVDDVTFDVAVFTNLSRDHLDYHGSMAAYGAAKLRLFTDFPLQLAVLNLADPFAGEIQQQCRCPMVTYAAANKTSEADWTWHALGETSSARRVRWQTPLGEITADLPPIADYAVDNVTAAMIVAHTWGADLLALQPKLALLRQVPGRMETLTAPGQPNVVVDFAHTPDALRNVLSALRNQVRGRLVCVVGCGGDRDTGKRPQMAAAACELADEVWFTADNPRSESPAEIIRHMLAGVPEQNASSVLVEEDRAAAICGAIAQAEPVDLVLIAGKGHEDYQEVDGTRLPFDDRAVARQALGA